MVDALFIIRTVSRDARNLRIDLLKQDGYLACIAEIVTGQDGCGDFAGVSVKSEMQFAPEPPGPPMLLLIPFTLAKQFQSGAVDHQVHGAVRRRMRLPSGKVSATPAQGGVVRNEQIEPKQPEDTAGKSLGLP